MNIAILKYRKLLLGVLLSVWCISCTQVQQPTEPVANSGSKPENPVRGGTIVYRLASAPSTFNYLAASDEPSVVTAFYLLGSRLVDLDHRSRSFVPALAESWQLAPDGRTVDVKLRYGLKFSDGDALTAEDVAFTLQAIYDERTNSPAYRDSLLVDDKPIEVRVQGPESLQLVFPAQVASVETYLTNFAILPSHVLKADLDAGKLGGSWRIDSDPRSIVTSGPFVVESAQPGEFVTLARNPHYWKKDANGAPRPYVDKLVLRVAEDPNNALSMLLRGELDILDRLRPADFASLLQGAGAVKAVDSGPGMATDYMWFNLNPTKAGGERLDDKPKFKWFNDKRFRQAISAAVDRSTIAANALRGLATPLHGFVSPANQGWVSGSLPKAEYDLQKAGQLLKDAGFVTKGEGGSTELFDRDGNRVEFTLLLPAGNEPRALMAGVIQEDLAKLGIKMQVVPVEPPSLSERWAKTFDYDAILMGLAVTDFEPSSFSNFLLSSGATHQWHPLQKQPATPWEARIDELFAQQARERDQSRRAAIFSEIQNIIAGEAPMIPVVARHVLSSSNQRIGNYSPSIVMPNSLWNADELYVRQ